MTRPAWLSAASAALAIRQPFFAAIAVGTRMAVLRKEDPLSKEIQTAATDGIMIMFNEEFMNALAANDRLFVIAHEVMHMTTMTMQRRGSRHPMLWNVASDYAINDILVRSGIVNSKGITFPQKFQGQKRFKFCYDKKYEGMIAEDIYEKLKQDMKARQQAGNGSPACKSPGKGGSGASSGSDTDGAEEGYLDDHMDGKKFVQGESGEWKVEPMSADEAAVTQRRNISRAQAAYAAAKAVGKDPVGMDRILMELGDPKIDWKKYLAAAMTSSCGAEDYTFETPDNNFFWQGMTLPTLHQEMKPRVGVVIDASGSISDDDVRNVMTEVSGLINCYDSWEMQIISFDTKIYNAQTFDSSSGDDPLEYRVKGGGGTAFGPPLRWWLGEEKIDGETCNFKADLILFFTDGYGEGWYEQYADQLNVLWLMNTDVVPPWGRSVRYDQYA